MFKEILDEYRRRGYSLRRRTTPQRYCDEHARQQFYEQLKKIQLR